MAKMLEKETELELARQWKAARSERARARLVVAYQPMIKAIARKHLRAGIDVQDLVQEGTIGFMGALDNFDPDLGYGVGTLARFHIAARIQLYVAEFAGLIRLPNSRKIKGLISGCVSRIRAAESDKGEPLSTAEKAALCEEAGFSLGELEQFEMVMRPPKSLSHAAARDDDESGLDLPDEGADTEANFMAAQADDTAARVVEEAIAALPERTQRILRLRHLSPDFVSFDTIAAEIGVSRERIRRIEMNAMRDIRERLAAAGITTLSDLL